MLIIQKRAETTKYECAAQKTGIVNGKRMENAIKNAEAEVKRGYQAV